MPPFVHRVTIKNYKSIAGSVVELGPLTFLVGPNGAGKSNFLDALRIVADALNTTLDQALRDRSGIQWVRRLSRGHPTHFGIGLELTLPDGRPATYAFKVGAERDGGFAVQREECRIEGSLFGGPLHYSVENGRLAGSSVPIPTALERDRLALVAISGLPEFRPVFEGLRRMAFYNLNPDRIRDLQDPDPGQILARDGRNLAGVVRELGRIEGGRILEEVAEHLRTIVPGIASIAYKPLGPKETIEFKQEVAGDENPWRFPAAIMSDGTLRALGNLVAVFQARPDEQRRVTLVGIEEPEMALHPAAVAAIASALIYASRYVQVIVTTHSGDLLDHKEIGDEHLRAVSVEHGTTTIAPIDSASRSALREHLYTGGELLRMGQLEPDREAAAGGVKQSVFPFLRD